MKSDEVIPQINYFEIGQSASNWKINVQGADEQIISNDSASNKDYLNSI